MIDPDAPIGLFTRFWDWLTYRPWTDEQIAEQVARAVANTCYKKWHTENRYVELPLDQFTPLTDEEIANGDMDYLYQEHLEFEAIRAALAREDENSPC